MKHKKTGLDTKQLYKQELARGRHLRTWVRHHHRTVLILAGVAFFAAFIVYFAWKTQLPFAAEVVGDTAEHRVDKPIVIDLEQVVHPDFVATISPQVTGEWRTIQSPLGVRSIQFVAQEGFLPDVDYVITVSQLKRVTGQPLPNLGFTVTTEKAPDIIAITPTNDTQHVLPSSDIAIELERANRNLRSLRLAVDPATELTALPSENNDSLYKWRPHSPLKQGQHYAVSVFDDHSLDPNTPIVVTKFTIVAEPHVTKAANRTHFYPGDTIDVAFDVAMRTDQPGILCKCEGTGAWISDTEYKFTPSNLTVGSTYEYSVPAGLTSVHGGVREAAAQYEIKTPGAVVASFKSLGSSAATNAPIVVIFDQAVDKGSAESRFSLTPGVSGNFSWPNATTMVFMPSGYETQTSYRVSLAPGVKPLRFGLNSATGFAMNFTTAMPVVRLNVPIYRQQHRASCEAAALRMALAYRGIHDSDFGIVQRMGYNGQWKNQAANTWDDPFEMYVGDVNGLQSTFQGYGAYAPPIAKAAQSYGRSASIHYGVSASFIAEQIHAGHPVIIIGTVGGLSPRYTSWNGPNGQVHAWIGEHARTVIGVTGKASTPVSFLVNDPNTGSQFTWSSARLMADINAIPQLASQVIVVR